MPSVAASSVIRCSDSPILPRTPAVTSAAANAGRKDIQRDCSGRQEIHVVHRVEETALDQRHENNGNCEQQDMHRFPQQGTGHDGQGIERQEGTARCTRRCRQQHCKDKESKDFAEVGGGMVKPNQGMTLTSSEAHAIHSNPAIASQGWMKFRGSIANVAAPSTMPSSSSNRRVRPVSRLAAGMRDVGSIVC